MPTDIKNLATYVSDLATAFFGFTRDAEAPDLVLGKDLEIISIRNEEAHGRLCQYEYMDQKHGTVWVAIQNEVELSHKRAVESTVTTLKCRSLR